MPTKLTGTAKPEQAAPQEKGPNELAALQALGLNQFAKFGAAMTRTFGDIGAEMTSFLADRIKEDVKTQNEILHCKDINELQRIQAQFIQTAVAQYSSETGKLVSMSQDRLISVLNENTEGSSKD
ncbi:MAG: phasin family protein [Pseudomonadota bacterium]